MNVLSQIVFVFFVSAVVVFAAVEDGTGWRVLRDRNLQEAKQLAGLELNEVEWRPVVNGRTCEELRSCRMSFDERCVVSNSVCYEFLKKDCRNGSALDKCEVNWKSVLQTYDREVFSEFQSIMWSLFSMPPLKQRGLVRTITSSVSGDSSLMDTTLGLFDSMAKLLPLVEDDLTIGFDLAAWDEVVNSVRNAPERLSDTAVSLFDIDEAGVDGGGGFISELSNVFVLPEGFSFGEFLSTVRWDEGLLENIGLNDDSFLRIVRSFEDEKGLESLVMDLGLLVKNIQSIRQLIVSP